MHEGQQRLQQQFREINIYKDLEDRGTPPAAAPTTAPLRRKLAAKSPAIVASSPGETTDDEGDTTPLQTRADAKAFRRRNDMEKIGMKIIRQPAEHGIRHDTYKWVAQTETFYEASKYFQENSPNKLGHAHYRESRLSEEDMKSYLLHVSVAHLCNHLVTYLTFMSTICSTKRQAHQ